MSGHSKWATTKHRKEAQDSKRAGGFTKIARVITVAAREGGDPNFNFKLRMAIDKAREISMPKDNIDKAVKKGTGELKDGTILEDITYEGFGPDNSAFIVQTLTDNRNRTSSEFKHMFDKHGVGLGSPNSAMWMFDKVGGIKMERGEHPQEKAEMMTLEAGALDFEWLSENTLWIYTKPEEVQKVKDNLEKANLKVTESEIGYRAKNTLDPKDDETRKKIEDFYDILDSNEDVQNFWSNINI